MTVVRFGFAHCVYVGGQLDKDTHGYSTACCLAVCSMTSMLLSLRHAHFAEEACGTKLLKKKKRKKERKSVNSLSGQLLQLCRGQAVRS